MTPVLLGSPAERMAAEAVVGRAPALSLVGRDQPDLLTAVLAEMDVLVGGDTGVAHLAAALGTPVVTLFGPTDPALTAPRGPGCVVRHPVPCAPCFYRACPIDHPCLRSIDPTMVVDQVLSLLRPEARAAMTSQRSLGILHLAANRWWTGSADPVIRLVVALRERGHRVLLGVIPGDRFEPKAREAGLEPIADLHLQTRGGPLALLRDLRRLRAIVDAESIDVIHTHHSHDHWLAVLARARRSTARASPLFAPSTISGP